MTKTEKQILIAIAQSIGLLVKLSPASSSKQYDELTKAWIELNKTITE